jgi:hypothetical protein
VTTTIGISYENFDLRIGMQATTGYPVEVSASPSGETLMPVWQTFPLDEYDFTDLVGYLRDLVARENDAVQLGQMMRDLLFPGKVWELFIASRAMVKQQGKGLRIRLRVDPPELSVLPWEYCYDESHHFFALQRETPIVRYVAKQFAAETLTAPNPMKVLLAWAAPSDQRTLNIEQEVDLVTEALAWMIKAGRVELKVLPNATAVKLHGALASYPHVFHFIGHGVMQKGKGALVFENTYRQSQLLDADQLMFLLGDTGVKAVILNACKTASHDARDAIMGIAPALVQAEIPAVIAMQSDVPDRTALGFTRDLYRFLAAGYPLDAAVTEMRIGAYIGANDKTFWGIPALFMRAPDGVLWQPDPEAIALFAQAQDAAPQIGEKSIARLVRDLSNEVDQLRGEVGERDMRYVRRDLSDITELLAEDQPDGFKLKTALDRLIEDIKLTGSAKATDALLPNVELVKQLILEQYRE